MKSLLHHFAAVIDAYIFQSQEMDAASIHLKDWPWIDQYSSFVCAANAVKTPGIKQLLLNIILHRWTVYQ